MFVRDRHSTALDLSHWLGPLSPAFVAMHADERGAEGSAAAPGVAGIDQNKSRALQEGTDAAGTGQGNLPELRTLFHTLNNQLGIIITYAELLEAKAPDDGLRARAAQVLSAALDALGTSKQIRSTVVR